MLNLFVSSTTSSTEPSTINGQSYMGILDKYGLSYTQASGYLHIGEPQQIQGWILHISVIQTQVTLLLQKVLPVLQDEKLPFKLPVNPAQVDNLLSGVAGYHRLGKLITIYPLSDQQAVVLAQKLIHVTNECKGPAIPTDRLLGGCVFTRYGGFKPVYLTNEDGQTEGYIADYKGNMIKDEYAIPFRLPKGINWPFSELAKPYPPKASKLLNKHYLPIHTLKNDVKGKVIKALDLKNWMRIRWCIIKQGKWCMSADSAGRDIKDRLLWQQEVHEDLKGMVAIPEIYDYFEIKGDSYLVMEWIEGSSLRELIDATFRGRPWFSLPPAQRLPLLQYLLQVIELLKKLHTKGYIHRDTTPRNFLLDGSGLLVAIDLELCYHLRKQKPHPAFTLGTAGYLSPEQRVTQTPTMAQDIYGLGALMIEFFTGVSPTKFDTSHHQRIKDNLCYFIRDENIAGMISDCLHADPQCRPPLSAIAGFIELYSREVLRDTKAKILPLPSSSSAIQRTIDQALKALATGRFTGPDGIWFSKKTSGEKLIQNETAEFAYYPGIYEGVGGVIWLLARAETAGYDTPAVTGAFQHNLDFLLHHTQQFPPISPGLLSGAAGIALSLSKCIQAGWIENQESNRLLIRDCLSLPDTDVNIADGIAGQGITLLQCRELLGEDWVGTRLDTIYQTLLKRQQKDGSWILTQKGVQEKGVKLFGLLNGIAGILYFLLKYGSIYPEKEVLACAKKGLDYLASQAHITNGAYWWQVNATNRMVSPWLEDGHTGIALVFLKACEVFREDRYTTLAAGALYHHPEHILSNQLSLSSGLSGLGEVYLEAFRVFQNEEWQRRAGWIAGVLQHLYFEQTDGSVYWLQDHSTVGVADLMTGNAGIIHFLMRYHHPEKSGFPLLD